MIDKSLGQHFLDFTDKLCAMAGTNNSIDMLGAFSEDYKVDQSFRGYLVAIVKVEDADELEEVYNFGAAVGEAINILKERQKLSENYFNNGKGD